MDKKFMNKMDDMELDMVAGGGFLDTLKDATTSIVKSAAKPMKKLIEAGIDARYGRVIKQVDKLVDKLYKKVLPPQCG